jgi:hypothetical protein
MATQKRVLQTFFIKISNLLKQIKTIFIIFSKYLCGRHSRMSSGAGTAYPSGTPKEYCKLSLFYFTSLGFVLLCRMVSLR